MWQGGLCNMKHILMSYILGFALALPSQDLPTTTTPGPNCIRMTPEKERQIDLIVEKLGDFLDKISIEHEHFDIRLIKLSIEQHTEDEVEEKETVLQLSVNDCLVSGDDLEGTDHHRDTANLHEKEKEAKEAKLKQKQEAENSKPADAQKQKPENLKNIQNPQEYSDYSNVNEQTKNKHETQTNNEHSDAHEQKEANTLRKVQERQEKAEDISKTGDDFQHTEVKTEAADRNEADKLNNNDEQANPRKNFEILYLDLDENGQELVKAIGRKKKPQIVYVQERNSGQTEYWFLKRR